MNRIIVFLILLTSIESFGQSSKISLEIGGRLRATPIYINGVSGIIINPDPPVLIQQDPHLSGLSIFTGINYKVAKKIKLFYKAFVRYDEFITEQNNSGFVNLKKNIFIDHSIGVLYGIIKSRNCQLKGGFGVTFANGNSEFSYRRNTIDPSGNPTFSIHSGNFNFTTFDFPFEYSFKHISVGLTPSFTVNEKFAESSEMLLISFTISYAFPLKSSK